MFVIFIYIRYWFSSRSVVDAPIIDVSLMLPLEEFDDDSLCTGTTGLKMMQRWYRSQEFVT